MLINRLFGPFHRISRMVVRDNPAKRRKEIVEVKILVTLKFPEKKAFLGISQQIRNGGGQLEFGK